jgi:hypothetical protein
MIRTFCFNPHFIDTDLPLANYAQTALIDLDNDGMLEYIVGQQFGTIYWYKIHSPDNWSRHILGEDSPSDVGSCALDVDGDGWIDFVTGGAWYQNSRQVGKPFQHHIFDPTLSAVHDLIAADVDGDGRLEIITMSDQNNLRWYKIPVNYTRPWVRHDIAAAVHAGLAVGDLDNDGDLDLVRTNAWFENASGDGTQWIEHPIGPSSPPPTDFQPYFAFDATFAPSAM